MTEVIGKKVLLKDKDGEVIIPYVDYASAGRNVGDIFYTTRTDTELNGAVECNGGTYSTADFTGSQSIGELLSGGKVPYVSLAEYANIVSSKGSCRAFGWDGGTSFRVPLLKDVYIEAGTASSAGEFISESLPDHTHGFGGSEIPLYASGSGRKADISGGDGGQRIWITATDGANNSTYKNGAKVKPDSVRYRAMVQLAIKSTDEAVITATSALQQLSNKAELDLNNVSSVASSFKEQSVNWSMPDYTAGVSKSKSGFTADKSGWIYCTTSVNQSTQYVYINGASAYRFGNNGYTDYGGMTIPVCKNDVITTTSGITEIIFYPCKGAN